jgi:aspartate oxidase
VLDDPGIEVIEHALVVDLLTDADGAVCGVTLHVIGEGQVDGVGAAYGPGRGARHRRPRADLRLDDQPPVATGDGMAAALRAGARVTDLEFVQFHPTVLFLGEGSRGSSRSSPRPCAAKARSSSTDDGARFMQGRHPTRRPRAARRRRARHPRRHARPGVDHVWLDARHLGGSFLEKRFPSIVARCRELGFDPAVDLLPVAPAQHYASGGVETDLLGRTSLDGLYACGECSCTGVHGANRLASNSLLEGPGLRPPHRRRHRGPVRSGDLPQTEVGSTPGEDAVLDASRRIEVQRAMTLGSGPVRSAESTAGAQAALAALAAQPTTEAEPGPLTWETTNLPTSDRCSRRRAPARGDPRRARARGLPERDDARWLTHLTATRRGRRSGRHHRTPRRRPPMSEHVFPRRRRPPARRAGAGRGPRRRHRRHHRRDHPEEQESVSHLVARADGVVAGLPVVALVVEAVDARLGTGVVWVDLHVTDGDAVVRGDTSPPFAGRPARR